MPNAAAHVAAAIHNLDVASHLLETPSYHDWSVITTFYAALHMVEAVLATDPHSPCQHAHSHETRDGILRDTVHLNHIFKPYSAIYRAAYIARYNCDKTTTGAGACFARFMPPHLVVDTIIRYRMSLVVQSTGQFLRPEHATQIDNAYKLLSEGDAAKKYAPLTGVTTPPGRTSSP